MRFGIEPARATGMTMKQFKAVCAYAQREGSRAAGDEMLEKLRENIFGAAGSLRKF